MRRKIGRLAEKRRENEARKCVQRWRRLSCGETRLLDDAMNVRRWALDENQKGLV